ncbi:CRISPR-associated helicase/endonuclease Cas3 [Sinosporangium siamense]|uniref:CRISPR-associated helicase/endonuclease Cas3 n=1 Tax=Sinosporangium siamense TaxID=1367973 RepID=A0A919RLH8_9ACTN|nr:CRISPR-associated helicase/endonuclease Cas3 [Sinosporangium siamense]
MADLLVGSLIGPRSREELRAAFGPLGAADAWIATLCGLHDLGKCCPAFQGLKVDLATARFGEPAAADIHLVQRRREPGRRYDTPHGLVTAMHMKDMLLQWGAISDTADLIASAIGGHHGHFPDGTELRQARREVNNHGGQAWKARRDDLVGEVVTLRGLPQPDEARWRDVRMSEAAATMLAALTTVSDWIASDLRYFPYADTEDLVSYAGTVHKLAADAVEQLKLHPWTPRTRFGELFPGTTARPVQILVEHLTADRAEPTLLLVEAPTGEGKSKAALQAAAALVRNLGLMGTYVAMPTKATSNQMSEELRAVADGVTVRSIYSGAGESITPTDVGCDEARDSDTQAQEWFTRKKNLLTPVGAGTIDQALKGAIRSGHVFVRLAALTNKVVVIDEVHAYDTYMSTLLDRLLVWLGRLGTSVVMLSATLPSKRRQELVAAWQSGLLRCLPRDVPRMEPATDYPRVTLAGTGKPVVEPAEVCEINDTRVLRLTRVQDDEIADWALEQVADGGGAVVMHNLVRRVVDTHAALEARIADLPEGERPQLFVIHGRLPDDERREVESALKKAYGRDGDRRKAIVVSSQVLEQGLDLDFDALLTDLAPVDWLIQRAGRLHRHSRAAHRGEPTLAIAGITDTGEGPVFPPYLHTVYAPMTMLRTWALLRDRTVLDLSGGEVSRLVDTVYGRAEAIPCPTGWERRWQDAAEKLTRQQEAAERDARVMYLPHPNAVDHLAELTKHSKNAGQTRGRR